MLPKPGEDQISTLLNEWALLKEILYKKVGNKLVNGELYWEEAFRAVIGQDLSSILSLDLLRSLPPTSVKNETTFSSMKLLKTKRRGRMNSDRLNDLILVHLESPSIEDFDPNESIKEWMITPSGQSRRLEYHRTSTAVTTPATAASSETTEVDDRGVVQLQPLFSKNVSDSESDEDSGDSAFEDDDVEMSSDYVFSLHGTLSRE